MKKISTLILLLSLYYTAAYTQNFSGKIVYSNTFKDLQGKDAGARMEAFFGKEAHYFINDSNYKAYDQDQRLLYLYNASTNTYYSSMPGKTELNKIDAGKKSDEKYQLAKMPETATICGYECISIQEKTASATTLYFFSPNIKVNKTAFQQHAYGNWNGYLEASGGALPLKIIYTDTKNGFVWTATATTVQPMRLAATDFDVTSQIKTKPAATPNGWVPYSTKNWSVQFPGKPEESQQTTPTAIGDQTLNIYMYTSPDENKADNLVYGMIQTIFPDSIVNSNKTEMVDPLMRNAVDGAAKNVQGKLLSESVISKNGYPGREVKIAFQQDAYIINARIYLVKNYLYMLQTICSKNKDNNKSSSTFMDSFELKN
ncbi:MAG: hypothetical protein QM802_16020 [Agriterribacter sp.]